MGPGTAAGDSRNIPISRRSVGQSRATRTGEQPSDHDADRVRVGTSFDWETPFIVEVEEDEDGKQAGDREVLLVQSLLRE